MSKLILLFLILVPFIVHGEADCEPDPEPVFGAIFSVGRIATTAGRLVATAGRAAATAGRAAATAGRVATNAGRTIGRASVQAAKTAGKATSKASKSVTRGVRKLASSGKGKGSQSAGASRLLDKQDSLSQGPTTPRTFTPHHFPPPPTGPPRAIVPPTVPSTADLFKKAQPAVPDSTKSKMPKPTEVLTSERAFTPGVQGTRAAKVHNMGKSPKTKGNPRKIIKGPEANRMQKQNRRRVREQNRRRRKKNRRPTQRFRTQKEGSTNELGNRRRHPHDDAVRPYSRNRGTLHHRGGTSSYQHTRSSDVYRHDGFMEGTDKLNKRKTKGKKK